MYIVLPLNKAYLTAAGKHVNFEGAVDTGYFLNKIRSRMNLVERKNSIEKIPLRVRAP